MLLWVYEEGYWSNGQWLLITPVWSCEGLIVIILFLNQRRLL